MGMATQEGQFPRTKRKESENAGAYQRGNARLPVSLSIGQCCKAYTPTRHRISTVFASCVSGGVVVAQ